MVEVLLMVLLRLRDVLSIVVYDGIENSVYYNSTKVGVVCRRSPNLNMGLFSNALS